MDVSTVHLNPDEQLFLASWEEIYMRGHFTFWVLLAVSRGCDSAQSIVAFIDLYAPAVQVQEQSLYRALRRYDDAGLVDVTKGITKKHKKYSISSVGKNILLAFITRNILPLQSKALNDEIKEIV